MTPDQPTPTTPIPAPPHAARLVVVETTYHAVRGRDPVTTSVRFNRLLTSDEQAYSRVTKLGTEWTPVDTGWIKDPGLITISVPGDSKSPLQVALQKPNYEPQEQWIVSYAEVPINESIRLTPTAPLFIRASGPDCRVCINAYPK